MITWIKQKLFYSKLKKQIFLALEHGDEWINMLTKLATSCKDMTPEDLRKEFMATLCETIHDANEKQKTK